MKKMFFILLPVSLFVACQKSELPAAEPAEEVVESRARPGGGGGTSSFTVRIDAVTVNPTSPSGSYVGAYGYIGSGSGGSSVSERGFCYSTSPAPTIANSTVPAGSGAGNFWVSIGWPAPGTYFIRVYAVKKGVVYYSYNQLSFIVPE